MTELDIFSQYQISLNKGTIEKGLYCGILMPTAALPQCTSRNAWATMDEPQYATLFFSLTRTVLFLKETALDSILNTYQENHLQWTPK